MLPIAEPDYTDLERKYLLAAYDSGWVSSKGHFVEQFEEKFAQWLGVNYALTVCNGTCALHLALMALKPEVMFPKVYVTPNSYYACSNVPKSCGMQIDEALGANLFIIVHNYGYISGIGDEQKTIEDCAEALGSSNAGITGAISTFSFYANKTLSTGEGGMVCTNRRDLYLKMKHLRNQAMIEPYIHVGVGYNYRMTNLQAALGCAQLERIDELLEKKRNITKWYDKYIGLTRFAPVEDGVVLWMNVFKVKNRDKLKAYMASHDIETRPGFGASDGLIMLPSGTKLTEDQVRHICDAANAYNDKN